jgi:hypothetical protein
MKSMLTIAALAGVAIGARHFLMFMTRNGKDRLQRRKLEVWEGEGGAVPVAATRTAAQIAPHRRPGLSPRDNF